MVEEKTPSAPPVVLVAAADASFTSFLTYIFRNIGLHVLVENNGQRLVERIQEALPDVLLLESRLPGMEIKALCARLRLDKRTRSTAILVLAGDDADEIEEILASGADEVLIKPFSPEKVMASVRAVLREAKRLSEGHSPELLTFRDLEMDLGTYRVRRNGRDVHLAPTEFRLLHHLIKNPRRVYSRDELQSAAWPRDVHFGSRTVDVHIGRLRHALKTAGGPDLIRTVRSVGYALSD